MFYENIMARYKACYCCGQIHQLPRLATGQFAKCVRCQTTIEKPERSLRASNRTVALSMAALILYLPAILLPIVQIEKLGHHRESSIIMGTIDLLKNGDWFVGLVVLLFSVICPLVKILLMLELSLFQLFQRRHKALTYRLMEHAGKWSMMDVMLLAFIVMLVKLGNIVEFRFGPGIVAFILCVTLSMSASLLFDAHAIWEQSS